jgi:hypothetical protein
MLRLGVTSVIAGWFVMLGASFHGKLTISLGVLSTDFHKCRPSRRPCAARGHPTNVPARKGNAWVSIIRFGVRNWDLPALIYWLDRTQLEALCVLASLGLLGRHAITCFAIEERVLVAGFPRVDGGGEKRGGAMGAQKDILKKMWRLSGVVQQIVRLLLSFSIPCSYCSDHSCSGLPVPGPGLRLDRLVRCPLFSTVNIGDIYTRAVPQRTIPADTTLSEGATRLAISTILPVGVMGLQ